MFLSLGGLDAAPEADEMYEFTVQICLKCSVIFLTLFFSSLVFFFGTLWPHALHREIALIFAHYFSFLSLSALLELLFFLPLYFHDENARFSSVYFSYSLKSTGRWLALISACRSIG